MAASNGFPGLFSPITLTNRAAACNGRKPGWLDSATDAELNDPLSRLGAAARTARHYLDPAQTRYLHLDDGGVADTLALRAGGATMQNPGVVPDTLCQRGLDRVRRLLVLSIAGQGTQDTSLAQRRVVGGLFSIFGLVSGAQIDR